MRYTLHHGDNREVLKTFADNSVDSIVTDPPYELGFMGKKWDSTGIAYDQSLWAECLRVLKPGGHLIAFGGTRTYHRMTCAIEDAGFEIRDCIQWIYGSGFPKSLDVSKAIDKQAGATREVVGVHPYANRGTAQSLQSVNLSGSPEREQFITAPATPEAQQWHGFGTALKPANEPAVLARKPLSGTVADNVMTWGCGALNIDGCRVGSEQLTRKKGNSTTTSYGSDRTWNTSTTPRIDWTGTGRWPANVILDEEAAQMLDEQSGHGVSRFFYVTHKEHFCTLCYNTYVKDITKEQLCESICASNVANYGWTTQETSEFTAHVLALMTQGEQLAQTVKSVTNLCDLCAMSIVVALVETKTSGFNRQACEHILDCMPKSVSYTLIQNLAYYAEKMDSIDTIQIIQSLWKLFGSVHHATENCIKQEKAARAEEDNALGMATRFLYNAKASKAEREAGLDGMEKSPQ